ncbi:MAG: cytidylate kinase family protein [Candidatus Uhrbacteria bacterium]
MIIAITGLPGSGKTTVVKMLAEEFKIPWYSVGDMRGKMALERGLTIDELNKLGEKEIFTDKEVDDYQTKLGQSGESFIIDGRLSWYFIPTAFKIFLTVDPDEAAKRIMGAPREDRQDEKNYQTVEEIKKAVTERVVSDQKRYQKYYNVDILDQSHYDLVIDSTKLTPEEITTKIRTKITE